MTTRYTCARGRLPTRPKCHGERAAVADEARRAISDFRSKDGPGPGLFADMRLTLTQARGRGGPGRQHEAIKHTSCCALLQPPRLLDLDADFSGQYRNGVLENGKRKALRIWLAAPGLFEEGPAARVERRRRMPCGSRRGRPTSACTVKPDRRRRLCYRRHHWRTVPAVAASVPASFRVSDRGRFGLRQNTGLYRPRFRGRWQPRGE